MKSTPPGQMQFSFKPIGFIRTEIAKEEIPGHWSHSDVVGWIEIEERYLPGARDIRGGDQI